MKNKLLQFINEFENSNMFITVSNTNTAKPYRKRLSYNDIVDNGDVFNWFLNLPMDNIQIIKERTNGVTSNQKTNYRKQGVVFIDLREIRNSTQNKDQNINGLNGGLQGINQAGVQYLFTKLQNEYNDLKSTSSIKIQDLSNRLENRESKLKDVKNVLRDIKSENKLQEKLDDYKSDNKPIIDKDTIETYSPLLKPILEGLLNKYTGGLNAAKNVEVNNLSEAKTQFIEIVKKTEDSILQKLYIVLKGLGQENNEFNIELEKLLIKYQIIQN